MMPPRDPGPFLRSNNFTITPTPASARDNLTPWKEPDMPDSLDNHHGSPRAAKTIGLTDADMAFLRAALLKGLDAGILDESECVQAARLIHRFGRAG